MNVLRNDPVATHSHMGVQMELYENGRLDPAGGNKDMSLLFDVLATLDHRKRMLVRRSGAYLVGCAGVIELLDLGSCLRLTNGMVGVAQPKYDKGLQRLLAVQSPDVRSLILPCEKGGGHLIMRATSLKDTIVCISLQHASEVFEPELPNLEEVFHLTKTEAMIVHDLFMGHTPLMIANDHNNSVHTVRAHIRRCYDKLGITCREELWSKLNAYRLT